MNDWNPELYLQYKNERIQPCIDLVNRIDYPNPKNIIDFGCGPGNSTQILVNRWPEAHIIGLDNSPAMIEKARKDFPGQEWILADARTYVSDLKFDIIFSNAAIQWMPDTKALLNKFYELLSYDGIIAVEVPLFFEMPLGILIEKTAKDNRWKDKTGNVFDQFSIYNYSFYYDELSSLFNQIEMWETDYMNILNSHEDIMNMMRGTGLMPYLNKLHDDKSREEFEKEVYNGITQAYPKQRGGKVILPFKRLFFIARK